MIESGEAAALRWNDLARDMKYSRASAGYCARDSSRFAITGRWIFAGRRWRAIGARAMLKRAIEQPRGAINAPADGQRNESSRENNKGFSRCPPVLLCPPGTGSFTGR